MTGPHETSPDAAIALWIERFNTRDPARIAALYADTATLLGTSKSHIYRGSTEIAGYFTGNATVKLATQIVHPLADDTVLSVGTYIFTRMQDGEPVSVPARFSFVFQRQAGSWVVLHHHSSSFPD